jgi:two-component system sensor histidine kinase/response regulator
MISIMSDNNTSSRAARAYFDYALNGIVETNADGRILRANSAAASILGKTRRHLQQQNFYTLLAALEEEDPQHFQATLNEQGIHQGALQLADAQASVLIELASVEIGEELYLHVFDDITERRATTSALEQARDEAHRANQSKSDFLSSISHELRTPMNGIIGLTQLALRTELNSKQRDYLEKIALSAKNLLNIVNDLLDFAKIDAGKLSLEVRSFSLWDLLDEIGVLATQSTQHRALEVVFNIDPALPDQCLGDSLRIGQCLNNLLSNALKFTPTGWVEVRLERVANELCCHVADSGIGIQPEHLPHLFNPFHQAEASTARHYGGSGLGLSIVHDLAQRMGGRLEVESSPGVGSCFSLYLPLQPDPQSADTRLQACSPHLPILLRSTQTRTRKALARLLAGRGFEVHDTAHPDLEPALLLLDNAGLTEEEEQHWLTHTLPAVVLSHPQHPTMSAWSQRHNSVLLDPPLTPAALERALLHLGFACRHHTHPSAASVDARHFSGRRVLVAEDNPVNQLVIRELLEQAQLEVTLVEDGRKALAQATHDAGIDLILMDLHMPEMNGLEASTALRAAGFTRPIIALTAAAGREERSAANAAGMDDFLSKPIDSEALSACLARWLPDTPLAAAAENVQAGFDPNDPFLGRSDIRAKAERAFAEHHRHDIPALRQAILDQNEDRIHQLAHGLKGAAATLGFEGIAALARQLEQSADSDSRQSLIKQLEGQLQRELTRILDATV